MSIRNPIGSKDRGKQSRKSAASQKVRKRNSNGEVSIQARPSENKAKLKVG